MMDPYTHEVLARAERLRVCTCACDALSSERSRMWRAWLTAALAALMSLIPGVSAAASLL